MVLWLRSRTVSWKAVGSIPISHSGIFQPKVGSYPERACYGPNGKTEATQSSLIHFTDAPVRVLLGRETQVLPQPTQQVLVHCCCSWAWLTPGYLQRKDSLLNYERKCGEQPCKEVSPLNGIP